jgi:ABC-type Na+ efflux pump permease subunit
MSAVVLVSLYFLALTAFLGLDVLGKAPVSLIAVITAALGATAGVVVVAAFVVTDQATGGMARGLGIVAGGLGAAAAGAGLAGIGRLLSPWMTARKSRTS